MILIIDNYDSFAYNLYQSVAVLHKEVVVLRNDAISLEEIEELKPSGIILSPGPGRPEDAGICVEAIRRFGPRIPILGVCLGHQAIGLVYGGEVIQSPVILHGKESLIFHTRKNLFKGMPLPFKAGRYHSLAVIDADLEIEAETVDGIVMGVKHRTHPVYGVQFHPESIMTPEGQILIQNFVELCCAQKSFVHLDSAERHGVPEGASSLGCQHCQIEPAAIPTEGRATMKVYLEKLIRRENLTAEECREVLEKMESEAQIGAFLALLRAKGETVEELLGFVRALRSEAKPFEVSYPVLDIVGTGGDFAGTVNVSTGSAILAARCGIPVVKHGSRAVSSLSGSADVLEALGYSFENPKLSLEKTGFAFCLASQFYPMMQKMRPARQSLKIPSLFNVLGPLLNPAGTSHLMLGVYRPELVPVVAETLFKLGTKRSLVFHGFGLDELTCLGITDALLVTEKGIEPFRVDPEKLGLKLCKREDLQGGDAKTNAMLLGAALTGSSPLSETLVLNAAVGLFLYGLAASLQEGISLAKAALRRKSLKQVIESQPQAVLAEIKRSSPSMGKIGAIPDLAKRASLYVQGGAAAISVLTSSEFEGTLEDLGAVAKVLGHTPILRKDFILEPLQIAQAAAHGADAVLLIASFLKERTQEMLETAKKIGLEAIVEVHSEEDLSFFHGADMIAVNQRNLRDFSMHPKVHETMIGKIPDKALAIAASGIRSPEDAERIFRLGYKAILVGEALTRSENPLEFLSRISRCS